MKKVGFKPGVKERGVIDVQNHRRVGASSPK